MVLDLVAQRLSTAGLINPAETTSRETAAAILVAMHGSNGVMFLPDTEIDRVYNMFKAQLLSPFALCRFDAAVTTATVTSLGNRNRNCRTVACSKR